MKPAEAYILNQEEPFRSMLMQLQMIVETEFPAVDLKFKWKIPFYYLNDSPFCYFNCSKKKGFVDVAFWLSSHLVKHNNLLVSENRKVVKSLRYFSVDEIDSEILVSVLREAFSHKGKGFYKRK